MGSAMAYTASGDAPYEGIDMPRRLTHQNRLSTLMFQDMALPLANRFLLSSRVNLQYSWCPRVSSAPNIPSIISLRAYSFGLNSVAAFLLLGLERLMASFLCKRSTPP
ncbi:MAG: hypothetical protein F4Z46_03170 [Cenarchaeum sp. SB0667_bin_13]|nr:hypothetical protein [Cenarchaeum sp. SB0667_bin_13]